MLKLKLTKNGRLELNLKPRNHKRTKTKLKLINELKRQWNWHQVDLLMMQFVVVAGAAHRTDLQ